MKIEKVVFKILLFLLPVQLGYHFWPTWSLVWGIRVDYLSPTLYLTDLLVVTLFVFWLVRRGWKERRLTFSQKLFGIALLLVAIINTTTAEIWQGSFFAWLKVFEVLFLAYWVFTNFKGIKNQIPQLLSGSVIYITLIAIFQMIFQRSGGGLLYFLGERTFSASTPGIALADFWGKSFLRPYSIFSHPNSYAGFVLLALGIILALNYQTKLGKLEKLGIGLGVLGVIISFSQAAWLALGLMLILWFLGRGSRRVDWTWLFWLILGVALYFSFASSFLGSQLLQQGSHFPETIERRLELAALSGYLFSKNLFWGVGLENFIVKLPSLYQEVFWGSGRMVSWWLQPVHNIFLLTLSQVGFVGWGFLVFLFLKVSPRLKSNPWFLLPLLVILLTGSVDHYWLTLPQNFLLFGIFFAIILAWEK